MAQDRDRAVRAAERCHSRAHYLRDRDLQREINEGLNVVESWNGGNSVIFFGKGGDIASNRRDEQELSVLCLRVPPLPRRISTWVAKSIDPQRRSPNALEVRLRLHRDEPLTVHRQQSRPVKEVEPAT
jgi:hypothetical protein